MFTCQDRGNGNIWKLHTFSDASEEAYGDVSYITLIYSSGEISSHFVAAKARVTTLFSISILRLELMGAVMGLRLTTGLEKFKV